MVKDKVLIEWRTNDKWKGVQQEIRRKDINPDGPLDIGQIVRVKFGQRRYDAVAPESWKPKSKGMSLFFPPPFLLWAFVASLSSLKCVFELNS